MTVVITCGLAPIHGIEQDSGSSGEGTEGYAGICNAITTTRIVELHGRHDGTRVLQFADTSLEKRNILFKQARAGYFGPCSVLAVVWTAVCEAATASGLAAVAFLVLGKGQSVWGERVNGMQSIIGGWRDVLPLVCDREDRPHPC